MCVLICKNVETEGPGTIAEFLDEKGLTYNVVELAKGETIPDTSDLDTLVILGGPMSANDEAEYPYIAREIDLVRSFVGAGKRVFGVCLGAQITARALGAEVTRGPEPEIGWLDVELTVDGAMDYPFRKLATHPQGGDVWKRFKVFHWHGETFDIPRGAVRLARSNLYGNQAFRYGRNVYAFQFHVEVTPEMIYGWLESEPLDQDRLRIETEKYYEVCRGRAWNFYTPFFKGTCEDSNS